MSSSEAILRSPDEAQEAASTPSADAIVAPPSGGDEEIGINEAAQLFNASPATVQRRIAEGVIPAVRGPGGAWRIKKTILYEAGIPSIIKRPVTKPSFEVSERGRIAADAFPLFDSGTPLDQIVIQLGVDPKMIRELFVEWTQLVRLSKQWLDPQSADPNTDPRLSAAGPRFNHEPNDDWSCCAVHQMQKRSMLEKNGKKKKK